MAAKRFRGVGEGFECVEVPHFYVHPAYVRAMPGPARGRLVNILSALLTCAQEADGRLVVSTPRGEVADLAGVSEQTIKRAERELQGLGLVRQLAHGRASRDLEILPPPTVPLRPICTPSKMREGVTCDPLPTPAVALRAVENSPPDPPSGGHPRPPQGVTGDPLAVRSTSPSLREKRESRRACARASRGGELDRPEPRIDSAQRASGGLGRELSDALEAAGSGPAYRLTRTQAAAVREAIGRRWESWRRMGASPEEATKVTREDARRVLDYALRAERPAAHLARSFARDWHSHAMPGTEAAAVAARGAAAERPVHDLDSRQGPAFALCSPLGDEDDPNLAPDLERALARYARAVEAAPLNRAQRAQLRTLRPRSAGEALELALQLERAALAAQATDR